MNIFKIKVKSYLSIVLVTIVTSILVLQGCHSSKNKTEVTSMYANTSNWAYLAYDKDLSSTLTPKNISGHAKKLWDQNVLVLSFLIHALVSRRSTGH